MNTSQQRADASEDAITTQEKLAILIVDDEPDLCTLVSLALQSTGKCDVVSAGNAREGLRAVDERTVPFDLVLLDIQMPDTTGVELCTILRKTPGYEQVPILMLTAMTERRFLQDAFAAGADDYIAKPFDLDDVKARLMRARQIGQTRARLRGSSAEAFGSSRNAAPRETIRDLEDAVSLPSASRFVTREAFEVFALQSAHRPGTPLIFQALRIAGSHDLFTRLGADTFQQVVEEVGGLLSRLSEDKTAIHAHLGNGMFVTVRTGKSSLGSASVDEAIGGNARLRELTHGAPPLRVVVGEDVRVVGTSKSDVMFHQSQAVASAVAAEERVSSWGNFREWLSFRKSVGLERARIDKSGYQTILNDFIEDGELGWE